MSSTPEDLEKEAEKMKELRPISVVVITIVVAVVIGAGAGWFVVKRQAQEVSYAELAGGSAGQ